MADDWKAKARATEDRLDAAQALLIKVASELREACDIDNLNGLETLADEIEEFVTNG